MEKFGVRPDLACYTAVIGACGHDQLWGRGLALLAEMQKRGVQPDAMAYCAAITACNQGQQYDKALSLLVEMEERGVAPHEATFHAAMQALVSANQFDAAFKLLESVQASPVASNSYTTHLLLLSACRQSGDGRAAAVQRDIHRLELVSLPALVKCHTGEVDLAHTNGAGDPALDAALERLYSDVCEQTAYQPRFEALPYDFTERSDKADQVASLKFHAEKKALADLLRKGTNDLTMRVNIGVCVDCHSFLAHASQLLGRTIEVLEPSVKHTFHENTCSCPVGESSQSGVGPVAGRVAVGDA